MKLRFLVLLFCVVILSGCNVFSKRVKTGIQVMTSEVPSSVFINGQFIEKTPVIDKSLPPGQYSLKIVPDDSSYAAYETSVVLRQGLLTVVTWKPGKTLETSGGVIYEMEPLKDKNAAEISFTSIPDGIILTLDNGSKEFSPKIFTAIMPGNHTFEATLPSYATQNHTLNVVQGYRMLVKVKLAKSEYIAPSATPTPAVSSPSASVASESAAASPSAVLGKGVRILATNYFVNGEEVLKMRREPSATSPEVGVVSVGKTYAFLDERDEWFYINTTTVKGWISKKYGLVIE